MRQSQVLEFGSSIAVLLAAGLCVGAGHAIERWSNRSAPVAGSTWFNLGCFVPASILQSVALPLVAGTTVLAVKALGGGLIVLPDHGWGLPLGLVIYTLAMDLAEYVYHRAQHRFPILWAMHSLHHSDAEFNVSTTIRHFWADPLIKACTVYLLVGLSFRSSPAIVEIYGVLAYYNYVAHMDVRLGFGRWSWLLNSPRYHRLHHSSRPGDENANFAALLPFWDVLTGAYRAPRPGDYPPTGLTDEPGPSSVVGAIVWPLRANLGVGAPKRRAAAT